MQMQLSKNVTHCKLYTEMLTHFECHHKITMIKLHEKFLLAELRIHTCKDVQQTVDCCRDREMLSCTLCEPAA